MATNGDSKFQLQLNVANTSSCEAYPPFVQEVCMLTQSTFARKLDDPTPTSTTTQPPEELAQLYLSYLYKHMISILTERLSASIVKNTPIDFILTVPAIWSNAAKQKTETAAVRAGFKGSKKIHLVSEPVHISLCDIKSTLISVL